MILTDQLFRKATTDQRRQETGRSTGVTLTLIVFDQFEHLPGGIDDAHPEHLLPKFGLAFQHSQHIAMRRRCDAQVQMLRIAGDFADQFVMGENVQTANGRVMCDRIASNWDPISRSEIDRFGKVEALIEARVVRTRKRDDEFAGMLMNR